MKDLFISECRRFRNAALVFAAAHLLLQLYAHRMIDLLQSRWDIHVMALVLYLIAGLGFALYQIGSYRQPSRWLWLMHRPLPRGAIFGAIALASLMLIVFAVGVPALLAVLGTDLLSGRTVDARHYVLVLHVILVTVIAWLAGAYVMLNRSKSAIVILVLPYLMLGHLASGYVMLAPALLCVALLAGAVYGAFRPNRTAPPASAAALLVTALPLQFGFYLALLWTGSAAFQYGQMLAGVDPKTRPVPIADGFTESTRSERRAAMLRGLAASSDPRAAEWKAQVPMVEFAYIEARGRQFPVRHQISNQDNLRWKDNQRHVEWTFSHDAMRFHGRDTWTSEDRGWFGAGGLNDTRPFPAVPVLHGEEIITPQEIYAVDEATQAAHQRVGLKAPEMLAGWAKRVGKRLFILTNLRLIAYEPPAPGDKAGMLREQFSVELPGPFSDLGRVDIAPLSDGTLLSFNFGRQLVEGETGSEQIVMLADAAGVAQVVARRAMAHEFPLLFEHKDWWLSPLLHGALALPDLLLDKGLVPDRGLSSYSNPLWRTRPPPVLAAAMLLALLSAAASWAWLRPVEIGRRRKAGWILAGLLLGPPSVLCLMLLQPRPARLAAPAMMSGAPAA